jgi:SAM-dependent methyltransferase
MGVVLPRTMAYTMDNLPRGTGSVTSDQIEHWQMRYAAGHSQRYPWDMVVSFLMSLPRRLGRPAETISVLELGCGTGANLWAAAREGFRATGIDASASAIETGLDFLRREGVEADLRVADFTALPFADGSFDAVIDRSALNCATYPEIERAMDEVTRVAVPGALFFSQGFAGEHESATAGIPGPPKTRRAIDRGTLAGQPQITFLDEADLTALLHPEWQLLDLRRVDIRDMLTGVGSHVEWRAVARRLGN